MGTRCSANQIHRPAWLNAEPRESEEVKTINPMIGVITPEKETTAGLCAACGIPLDSQHFDDSSVKKAPDVGGEVVLARFDLPAQYCGVLQYFAQYTDLFARDAAQVATPNLEWRILVNNHALFPYINLRRIVNPWGYGSFPVNIRLDEDSTIEMVVRGVPDDESQNALAPRLTKVEPVSRGRRVTSNKSRSAGEPGLTRIVLVGGRIVGRFWYNASYGDVLGRDY